MTETLLTALMQLFALLTDINQEKRSGSARAMVNTYLKRYFNDHYAELYLKQFDHYLESFHEAKSNKDTEAYKREHSENKQKILEICRHLNTEMEKRDKVLLFVQLMGFLRKEEEIGKREHQLLDSLALNMLTNQGDYKRLKKFVLDHPLSIDNKNSLLLITGDEEDKKLGYKFIHHPKQKVKVWVLLLFDSQTFVFRFAGERNLYLNGHALQQDRTYVLAQGAVIKTSLMPSVYYSKIAEKFLDSSQKTKILYKAIDVEYKFNPNQTAVHPFSLLCRSGQLVGIIGSSGTGKSTLLNVLNGNFKLNKGSITINGYDLHSEKEELEGVIGYVPQSDLLIEELTVFENLYYNARLCFSKQSRDKINETVEQALKDFDLVEAKNLVVGNPLKKILSGGQRKRLNIALELLREPSILFVDEPTSGLSSMDSEKVMYLLKRQTLKGKLVILNIHQPSSELFKMLDKLLMVDKGGRIIFNGNPMDSIEYFKRKANYVNPEERECTTCGNVKTEQLLRIVEARMVNPDGKLIRERKTKPEAWYKSYREKIESRFNWKDNKNLNKKEQLPPNLFKRPKRFEQFKIYFMRDALAKLKDSQYLLINFLEAPLLAIILGFFTKYIINPQTQEYIFANNVNIPAYLFMSIIVALFIGLSVSAEEIIKDRSLLQRESFLNLSRFSYMNSKVLVLFIISAIQMFSFVVLGNWILEIKGLSFSYWLILFSVACFANMLGLNISSGLNTVVSIYILIPLILVPQILFSGVIVEFDKLHSTISSEEKVPFIGNIMASRWGYEALAVNQFKNNEFDKHFFDIELQMSTSSYYSSLLIPELKTRNNEIKWAKSHNNQNTITKNVNILQNGLKIITKASRLRAPEFELAQYNDSIHQQINNYLEKSKQEFSAKYKYYTKQKDEAYNKLLATFGNADAIWELRKSYQNKSLSDWMLQKKESKQIVLYGDKYIRKKQPIYNISDNRWGNAHFYSPYKKIGSISLSTPMFNVIFLWLYSALLYISLYFDALRSVIKYIENFQLKRQNKRQMKNNI